MQRLLVQLSESATLLDALAIVSSLLILLYLMRNRRLYGSLVVTRNQIKAVSGFSDEVLLQMISQQSQKAYDNLKQSLTQEFETLRMIGGGALLPDTMDKGTGSSDRRIQPAAAPTSQHRRRRYRQAEQLLYRGVDASQIEQQCGLGEGEIELLKGLQQLAQDRKNVNA